MSGGYATGVTRLTLSERKKHQRQERRWRTNDMRDWWIDLFESDRPPRPWVKDAECRGKDPNIFYPDPTYGANRRAKRICKRCPVRLECLKYAIETDDRYGIHGGIGERDRVRMARLGATAEEMIEVEDLKEKLIG